MEVIKKTVKRALIVSGVTDTEFAIVPDLNTHYNFKILLTSQVRDIGFFDAFVEPYGYPYGSEVNNTQPFIGFENLYL